MIKNIFKSVCRFELRRWLLWQAVPGLLLTTTMLVLAVGMSDWRYRAAEIVAAVVTVITTLLSTKDLINQTLERWSASLSRNRQAPMAQRVPFSFFAGEVALLERLIARDRILLPALLGAVEPRIISWLSQATKQLILETIENESAVVAWPTEIIAALETARCTNCGTPLNGMDHNYDDC